MQIEHKETVVKQYVVTLNERELMDLCILIGKVSGAPGGTIRETTDKFYEMAMRNFPWNSSFNNEARGRLSGLSVNIPEVNYGA